MRRDDFVYICSPLRGNGETSTEENAARARYYCKMVALLHPELIPIAPHIYFTQFLSDDDPAGRAWGMEKGLELLDICGTIAVEGLGRKEPSEGMAGEIKRAKENGIRIIDLDELITPARLAGMDAAADASAPLLRSAT